MSAIELIPKFEQTYEEKLRWFFPSVEQVYQPYGGRVLVQLKRVSTKTAGGIQLTSDAIDTEKWNTQVGVLVAMGPLAFKKKDTMEPWPEGAWARIGDFVRTPKYGGDRTEVQVPGEDEDVVILACFNDHELIGKIISDPLSIRAFI